MAESQYNPAHEYDANPGAALRGSKCAGDRVWQLLLVFW